MERAQELSAPRLARAAEGARVARLGVIDVGSNTARLVVYESIPRGGLRAVLEWKEVPRLGQGVDASGQLAADAMDRGVGALRRFAQHLEEAGNPPTVAVTTSAVRDAPNGPEFVARVAKEAGLALRILSGEEEAHYAYLGIAGAWELGNDTVCDLGGGSLQLLRTRKGIPHASVSLPLGALRMTQRFLEHDPPKDREIEALQDHVRKTLKESELLDEEGLLFGVGGTIRCLGRVASQQREYPLSRVHGYPLHRRDVEVLEKLLTDMSTDERRGVPGIGGDRADVIVAGLVVVDALLDLSDHASIVVSATGIREGLGLEAMHADLPASAEELAFRSMLSANRAFDFSLPHGEEVREIAVGLFDLVKGRFEWGTDERLALSVAAWMHDAGAAVDLWRHARHSAYLIRNFPIWGLDHRQILLSALTVLGHEGDDVPSASRKEVQTVLKASDVTTARRLGTILYVAERLRGTSPRFTLGQGGDKLIVRFDGDPETAMPARALEKIEKPVKRLLELEVDVRDS